jgi:SAM-dependent methyltransferase
MASSEDRPFTADTLSAGEIRLLKERERSSRDVGAATYLDRIRAARGAFQYRAEIDAIIGYLAPLADETALEAGAGVGRLALPVAQRVKRLVAVDLSPGALRVLSDEASARGIRNIETLACDLGALPRAMGPFDLAYSVEVLQHIPSHLERLTATRALYDVLRPGGRCLICVLAWTGRHRPAREGFWGEGEKRTYRYYFTAPETRSLLEESGFRDVSLRGLRILPGQLARRLPESLAFLETWCSRVPLFRPLGKLLVAMGRRPT